MKQNGYETTSIYYNLYFGYPKGPYIDNYFISGSKRGICSLLDEDVRSFGFWGYCTIDFKKGRCSLNRTEYRWAVWAYCRVFGPLVGVATEDSLMRHLTGLGGERPQFVIRAHSHSGPHSVEVSTTKNGDQAGGVQETRYRRRSNEAAIYMRQIIDHVRDNDAEAILFMFGDHGVKQTNRGLRSRMTPTFVVLDRYAILGGVYPRDRCARVSR